MASTFVSGSCLGLCRNILEHVKEVERTNGLITKELLSVQDELSRILEQISPSPPSPSFPPVAPPFPIVPSSPFQPPYPPFQPPSPLLPPMSPDTKLSPDFNIYINVLFRCILVVLIFFFCSCICNLIPRDDSDYLV